MKIFGKRTPARKKQPEEEPQHKGDEIVEKLLLEDPSTWNAKQRRLVKRYRERHGHGGKDGAPVAVRNTESSAGADEEEEQEEEEGRKPEAPEKESKVKEEDEDRSSDSSDDGSASSSSYGHDSDQEERDGSTKPGAAVSSPEPGKDLEKNHDSFSLAAKKHKRDHPTRDEDATDSNVHKDSSTRENPKVSQVSETEKSQGTQTKDAAESSSKNFSVDGDLQQILDKLNAKQRRKLVRSLERKEKDVAAVHAEAREFLGLDSTNDKKQDPSTSIDAERPKKKRRRNNVDLSKLPAEERLRREEQRRLQQEAAQARANGLAVTNIKHKHPLNSERRRANRRKPKWEAKRKKSNEHNSSGYHMRKIAGGGSS